MDELQISKNKWDYEGDKLATDYDEMQNNFPDEVRREILKCLDKNATQGAGRRFMLDVGCGGGKSAKLFVDDFEQILGIDISQSQIDMAKQRVTESNVTFKVVADYLLPVEDGSTDLVFCGISFHYLKAPVFFTECDRILVQGGVVACALFSPDILKRCDGQLICDYSVKPSKWEDLQREYHYNCGMDKEASKIHLSRYEEAYNSIKNPTKRRVIVATVDEIFTVKRFLKYQSTIAGYSKNNYPDPKQDPLNKFRDGLAKIFQEAGMECEDNTEFVITFNFTAMIIEKTKDFGIV